MDEEFPPYGRNLELAVAEDSSTGKPRRHSECPVPRPYLRDFAFAGTTKGVKGNACTDIGEGRDPTSGPHDLRVRSLMGVAKHPKSARPPAGSKFGRPRVSEGALVLAPFSGEALKVLGCSVPVTYESWTDTRRLHSPDELVQRINEEGIGIVVVEADFLFDEVFEGARPLRFVGVCRNSVDHVDVASATEHNVAVVNAPARNAEAVAELTIGLMLSLARSIPYLDRQVKDGRWEDPVGPYADMRGLELQGKTLGIIGLGAVGRTVSKLGSAFGMRVLACDPYVAAPGKVVAGATLVTLEDVLGSADFLSIHTPDTPETAGLLDKRRLGMMKPGSYIINSAAYSVIEEAALVEHLGSGHLAGAALDVHRAHPVPPSSPLLKLENVILTPHIGGATDGTIERHSRIMVEEIGRFLDGRRPRHLVNPEVWRRRG